MKSLLQYINEAKNDNLHQFVKYIETNGQYVQKPKGQHNHSWVCDQMESTKISIDDIMEHSDCFYDFYEEYKDYVTEYFDISKNDWDEDAALDLDGDDMGDLFWCITPKGEAAFLEFLNNRATEISYDFEIEDGMIYVERAITLPKFSSNDNDYDRLMKEYQGHLGTYWSWKTDASDTHWGNSKHSEYVTFYGYVDCDNVDWKSTKIANLNMPDECEITVKKGAPIYITAIKTAFRHNILKSPILMKA